MLSHENRRFRDRAFFYGSRLAEQILPHVVYVAIKLGSPVFLIRTFTLPTTSYFLAAHVSPPDMAELREKTK
jgi:hypothetical protein